MGQPHVNLALREVSIDIGSIRCLWPFDERGKLGKVRKSRTGVRGRDEGGELWVPPADYARAVRICASAVTDHMNRPQHPATPDQGKLFG